MTTTYDLSEGFMTDIAKLMNECVKENTDGCSLEFDINGKTLLVEFNFKVKQFYETKNIIYFNFNMQRFIINSAHFSHY